MLVTWQRAVVRPTIQYNTAVFCNECKAPLQYSECKAPIECIECNAPIQSKFNNNAINK